MTTVTSTTTVTAGGDGGISNPADIVFVHSFMDRDEPNFLLWNTSAKTYAEQKLGTFEEAVYGGDAEVMMNQLDQLALKYDPEKMVLLSWPGDEGGWRSVAEWGEANHVYTSFWYCEPADYDFSNSQYLVSASHDDSFKSGYETTDAMINELKDKGVTEFNFVWVGAGIYGWCWPLRVAGFLQRVSEEGEHGHVLGGNFTGWTRELSYELTTTLITKYGADVVNGGFSVFNGPGLGILDAFRDAGVEGPVVTIDLIPEVAQEIMNQDTDGAYMLAAINNNSRWAAMQNMSRVYKARLGLWEPATEEDRHWAFTGDVMDRTNIDDWYYKEYVWPSTDYEVDKYMWGQPGEFSSIYGIPGYRPQPTDEQVALLEEFTEEF